MKIFLWVVLCLALLSLANICFHVATGSWAVSAVLLGTVFINASSKFRRVA